MEVLNCIDDNTVKERANFFSDKKLFFLFLISTIITFVFSFHLKFLCEHDVKYDSTIIRVIFSSFFVIHLFATVSFIGIIIYRNMEGDNRYSRHDLIAMKEKYKLEREKVLARHRYNFSIFTHPWHGISEEHFCDSFSVNLDGEAFIKNDDSDYCLKETLEKVHYHHIIDNRDEHIITAKELKEKYLSDNQESK